MGVARQNAATAGEADGALGDLMKAIVQDHIGPPGTLDSCMPTDPGSVQGRASQGARRRGQPLRLAQAAR